MAAVPAFRFDPDDTLTATLSAVAGLLADAAHPWWIIGSAAVALHLGQNIDVRDVDIMLDPADARDIQQRLAIQPATIAAHPLFRSEEYFTWNANPLPSEFMAGFCLFAQGEWQAVSLTTRQEVQLGSAILYIPDVGELAALLKRFDRPKDRDRLALLEAAGFSV